MLYYFHFSIRNRFYKFCWWGFVMIICHSKKAFWFFLFSSNFIKEFNHWNAFCLTCSWAAVKQQPLLYCGQSHFSFTIQKFRYTVFAFLFLFSVHMFVKNWSFLAEKTWQILHFGENPYSISRHDIIACTTVWLKFFVHLIYLWILFAARTKEVEVKFCGISLLALVCPAQRVFTRENFPRMKTHDSAKHLKNSKTWL